MYLAINLFEFNKLKDIYICIVTQNSLPGSVGHGMHFSLSSVKWLSAQMHLPPMHFVGPLDSSHPKRAHVPDVSLVLLSHEVHFSGTIKNIFCTCFIVNPKCFFQFAFHTFLIFLNQKFCGELTKFFKLKESMIMKKFTITNTINYNF